MAEGCENAMTLWREIRDQGFIPMAARSDSFLNDGLGLG
jgi:hypothetical protein